MTPSTKNDPAAPWISHQVDLGRQPADFLDREWLLTNGTGAYAMGTVPAVNTRRYHGLFVAATHPPVGRIVALNQVLERLTLQKKRAQMTVEFSANLFRQGDGHIYKPEGHTFLRRFTKGLCAQWEYGWGELRLVRQLFLHWKEQAATLRYQLSFLDDSGSAARLAIAPMLTLRDFHALFHQNQGDLHTQPQAEPGVLTVRRDNVAVTFSCPGGAFVSDPQWWYRLSYPAETRRGQDDHEDQFVPGWFEVQLEPRREQEITFTVALGDRPAEPCCTEEPRLRHLLPLWNHVGALDQPRKKMLVAAADDFVVDRRYKDQLLCTVMAGYPWFADWGRDTFIAFDGLLLCTGRFTQARDTLRVFAGALHHGLVPNRFDDYNDQAAHYNTVDASLWFLHAAMRYVHVTDDQESWNAWLRDAALAILDAYIRGTDNDIRMAGDGLISAGNLGSQLTWMDAAANGVVFTPRCGKAVEINALWYHCLCGMAELIASSHPAQADHFNRLAGRVKRAFMKVFWDDARSCLFDHVRVDAQNQECRDPALRPNQVFVASLPHSPLPRTKQQQILDVLRAHLLTPFGLRTLPPEDPNYHGSYRGDPFERDKAYHQGTVWPWLIGPYAEGILRVGKFSKESRQEALAVLTPLLDQLAGPGLGQLHEIHEADPPFRPVGCIAQAWSVAEVLRVLILIEEGDRFAAVSDD
ncbi:MAG: glycogen debranching enzyme family protein [Phycisphaeraceae bacterium]|nr:glycogen debranching enzyme family protein [Phycisphaeraceae bacterium]